MKFSEWVHNLEDDVPGAVFSAARGLYWYAADYHEGQGSNLYGILSRIEYKPGALERSPSSEGSEESPVYDALVSGELDAVDVYSWIEEKLEDGWEELGVDKAERQEALRTAFDKKIREKLGDKMASKVKFDII